MNYLKITNGHIWGYSSEREIERERDNVCFFNLMEADDDDDDDNDTDRRL
jgi:hypothetical protein